MVTMEQIYKKAIELKAVKYAYSFYDIGKTQKNAICFFNKDNKEVVNFTLDFVGIEGFALNNVFPDGRKWGSFESLSEFILIKKGN